MILLSSFIYHLSSGTYIGTIGGSGGKEIGYVYGIGTGMSMSQTNNDKTNTVIVSDKGIALK